MRKLLILVDCQNDFITGSLGSEMAVIAMNNLVRKLSSIEEDTYIAFTKDTHYVNYLDYTLEGNRLPVEHCMKSTWGWEISEDIVNAVKNNPFLKIDSLGCSILRPDGNISSTFEKETFGSRELFSFLENSYYDEIEIVGLCTDICVMANAVIARTACPNTIIKVDGSCCAGTNEGRHYAALNVMESLQIDVKY